LSFSIGAGDARRGGDDRGEVLDLTVDGVGAAVAAVAAPAPVVGVDP
jgi:hypothetical protein